MIKLKNINKKYNDKEIIKNFNLEINDGDFISITGSSGKGKTTLLNIIGLLEKPSDGIISYNGKPVNYKNVDKLLREDIAYVFQNFGLIDTETIKYNLK